MAVSGMQMMMKSLGLDPDELKANVQGFMVTMKAAVEKVEANQLRIEVKLEEILKQGAERMAMMKEPLVYSGSSRPIYEDGKHTGVILTDEKFPREMYDSAQEFTGVRQGEQAENGR